MKHLRTLDSKYGFKGVSIVNLDIVDILLGFFDCYSQKMSTIRETTVNNILDLYFVVKTQLLVEYVVELQRCDCASSEVVATWMQCNAVERCRKLVRWNTFLVGLFRVEST